MSNPAGRHDHHHLDEPYSPAPRDRVRDRGHLAHVLGFVADIDAAFDASGSGPGFFVADFFAGAAVVITTAVLAVLGLSRGEHRGLWIGSLALPALPAVAILVLVVLVRS